MDEKYKGIDIFKFAARRKLRFDSVNGPLTVENLYDLPLESTTGKANLDDIALAIYAAIRQANVEVKSFVNSNTTVDYEDLPVNDKVFDLEVKLEVVKTVIADRRAVSQKAADRRANASERAEIAAELNRRKSQRLSAMSEDELTARLAELNK